MDVFTKDLTLEGCKEKQKDIGEFLRMSSDMSLEKGKLGVLMKF